ncbi:hypothetical protein C8F01DRAFT_1235424 [Mycena amicta]|nr:hypothetical protein C8F01DRAFT_1235424 [Mycena amicta]
MQAIAAPSTGLAFNVTCVNPSTGFLIDGATGLTISAWPAQSGSTISPITLETFTGRQGQIWSFSALD